MAQVTLGTTSLAEGVECYAKSWFRIDQLYRKFIWRMQKSGQATLMRELFEQVENHYVNSYLLRLNEAWQTASTGETWLAPPVPAQRTFYREHVGEFAGAIRRWPSFPTRFAGEVAEELLGRIRSLTATRPASSPCSVACRAIPSSEWRRSPNGELQIRTTTAARCW